jgi:hypothetical protein
VVAVHVYMGAGATVLGSHRQTHTATSLRARRVKAKSRYKPKLELIFLLSDKLRALVVQG